MSDVPKIVLEVTHCYCVEKYILPLVNVKVLSNGKFVEVFSFRFDTTGINDKKLISIIIDQMLKYHIGCSNTVNQAYHAQKVSLKRI